MLHDSIFKAYDIRGIYPEELDESAAYQIARGFVTHLIEENEMPEKIIVGQDARLSSPVLARAFIDGITDEGVDVADLGLATIDMIYFASVYWHLPACMVTASHNPKEWNGFKLMKKDIGFLGLDSGLLNIKELTAQKNWPELKIGSDIPKDNILSKKGKTTKEKIDAEYLNHVLGFIGVNNIRPMRVAIDCASGSVGPILKKILEKLPLEYQPLYFSPDGNFPSHGPNPSLDKNLEDLINIIESGHYHFGCAFDGDGDRIIFIDEKGKPVDPSIIGALISRHLLLKNHGGKIVYGLMASKILPETIKAYGGLAFREKVGHSFIKNKLKKVDGIFGVESSGHYFYENNFYADSGIITFLVMLDILSSHKKSLSILAREFSKYVSIRDRSLKVSDPDRLIKEMIKHFEGYDIDFLDGLTVETQDFWLNLRPSNTEPLFRLTIEAKNETTLNRVKKDITDLIEKYK